MSSESVGGSYRERRQARVERLNGWADKREARSDATLAGVERLAGMIPLGQPILLGHHSQRRAERDRDRIRRGMSAGVADAAKAREMRARAASIEAAAGRAVYSDDADAIERLSARVAAREAERDRIKAYNASCRRDARDASLLDDQQRAQLVSTARACAWQLGERGEMPAYVLTNLGASIRTDRRRLAELERAS
jgi:Domain of unknown function (DUF3560)